MTSIKQREYSRKYFQQLRQEMFDAYGRECQCCGEYHEEFLTLEHKNRTGKEHREKVGKGYMVLLDLRKRGWPKEGFTVFCMNCNFATRFGSMCPHDSSEIKEEAIRVDREFKRDMANYWNLRSM